MAEKKTDQKSVSRRKFIAAVGVGAVAVAAAGTGAYYYFGGAKQTGKTAVNVGFASPLTGSLTASAADQVNYYKQWVDQKNAEGGLNCGGTRLPVKLTFYDTQGDANQCVKTYERLMNEDKVDLILPPWGTFEHYAIIPLLAKYGYPCVANLADTDQVTTLTEPFYYFQGWNHYNQAMCVAKALKDNASKVTGGANRNIAVAVPYAQSMGPAEVGTDFVKIVGNMSGFDVVLQKDYPDSVTDLTPLLLQIKDAKPDAIVGGTYPPDFDLMLGQMIANKVDANVIYGWVGPYFDFLLKKYGANIEGVSSLGAAGYSVHDPAMKPFADAYNAKYGYYPAMGDYGLCVAAGQIVEQAVAVAGLDNEKIRQQLLNATFDTISGPIAFHGKPYCAEEQYQHEGILQWQNGVLEVVYHLPDSARATATFEIPKPAFT